METRRQRSTATGYNASGQQPNKKQKGNNHGGKRSNSGRKSKSETAAQFAQKDKKQPTIERTFGSMYSKQAKTSGAPRLTKVQALLKRDYEVNQKEREEQRRMNQGKAVDDATTAAQSLIDLYRYSQTTQENLSDSEDEDDLEYEGVDDEEDSLDDDNDFPSASTMTSRKRMQYQPPADSTLAIFLSAYKVKLIQQKILESGKKWFHLSAFDSEVDLDDTDGMIHREPEEDTFDENPRDKAANGKIKTSVDPFCSTARYCREIEVYIHAPLHQHKDLVPKRLSEFLCPNCQKSGNLISHSWHYRPAHKLDSVVWVLHERLVCSNRGNKDGCGRTIASFHRNFMKQLPNAVTEVFPFLMTPTGVGMHQSLMHQFMELCTKGILFSTFASSVNASKRSKYWSLHLNHLDRTHDKVSKLKNLNVTSSFVAQPFSPYDFAGEYNGIDLKPSLVRLLFLQVRANACHVKLYSTDCILVLTAVSDPPNFHQTMKSIEDYMQLSFQMNLDESESPDHSFKFAKMVMSIIRTGRIWTGTYDSISLAGLATMNILCHTKANSEILPAIEDNKRIRERTNAPKLKRLEGDGGQDSSAWLSVFSDSLVTPTRPNLRSYHKDLPRAYLQKQRILKLQCTFGITNWVGSMEEKLENFSNPVYFGLDTEQSCSTKETMVIQICLPEHICPQVVVIDLHKMDAVGPEKFQSKLKRLKRFLENPILVPVAVQVSHDVSALTELGVRLDNHTTVELMTLAKQYERDSSLHYGLKDLTSRHLGLFVDKRFQNDEWNPLTPEHFQYAALDAFLHLLLFQTITSSLKEGQRSGSIQLNHSGTKKREFSNEPGAKVVLTTRQAAVAYGTLIFVGGSGGKSRKFGGNNVGVGSCLVELYRVVSETAKPTSSYKKAPGQTIEWDHTKHTLAQIFGKHSKDGKLMMMWPSSRIVVDVASLANEEDTDNSDSDSEITESGGFLRQDGYLYDAETTDETDTKDPDTLEQKYCDDGVTSETDTKDAGMHCPLPLSRNFYDRFHLFNSFPSTRDKTEKAGLVLIRDLAFAAVTSFDQEDLSSVSKFLQEERNLTKWSSIVDHFIHNKEWWYRRVKMYPPDADQSVENVMFVIELVQMEEELQEFWSPKLEQWFENLLCMCRNGRLEETSDCVMFQEDGTDSFGLQLYIRRRGTNRSELLHQKMKVAFGPHGVGAEVGHYLLLLVTYKFNVSTGIRRLSRPDFGTFRLDIIDRIQIRYQQLFGRDFFPNHFNQELMKEQADYDPEIVSVGIRRLNYDTAYVQRGAPHESLKGDLLFMAKRSGVVCVPLPIAHRNEIIIFNEFLIQHPKPTETDWKNLAAEYLKKCDYLTVFPKLPSMLKTHFSKWQLNSHIKSLKRSPSINKSYYDLFHKFMGPKLYDLSPAAMFQKENCATNPSEIQALQDSKVEMTSTKVPANPMPVPPAAAPNQKVYIVSDVLKSLEVGDDRRQASSCVGAFWGCNLVKRNCCSRISQLASKCPAVKNDENKKKQLLEDMASVQALKLAFVTAKNSARRGEKRKYKHRTIPNQEATLQTPAVPNEAGVDALATHVIDNGSMPQKVREQPVKRQRVEQISDDSDSEMEVDDDATSGITLEKACNGEFSDALQVTSCLDSLQPGNWLNDLAMNCWRKRLNYLNKQSCGQHQKRSFILSTFFFTKLHNIGDNSGNEGVYNYANVKRWSRWVPGKDIFNLKKLLIPINHDQAHWLLACIDMEEEKIELMDSKRGTIRHDEGERYLHDIRRYLSDEYSARHDGQTLPGRWRLRRPNVPQQHNGNDCGAFTSMFAEELLLDNKLQFKQTDVNAYRQKMAEFVRDVAATRSTLN